MQDSPIALDLDRTVEVLARTPATLRALLGGASDFWVRRNYGEATFSPFDVVGHLIEAEKHNWIPRARHILEHGDTRPFPPFDRYAMYEANKGRRIDELLHEFDRRRRESLAAFGALNLTPDQLATPGLHPDLGRVTLSNLIATWVVHDLGHPHQIAKAMAFQYRDEVGPWVRFLTILPAREEGRT